jgi:hypothetical protein
MSVQSLSLTVGERGTVSISFTFYDSATPPATVVPKSANWTLSDKYGNIINNRHEEDISSLASTVTVTLTDDDIQITGDDDDGERRFTVVAIYDSDLGSNLKLTAERSFQVQDYINV